MKNIITLPNRDGANLYLEKGKRISSDINEWNLKVDSEHDWVLKYTRVIYSPSQLDIEAVDPSGGPFIQLGEVFNGKHKIIKIINYTTFWLSEGNNN